MIISYSLASALQRDASKIKFTKALAAGAKSSPDVVVVVVVVSTLGCSQLLDLGVEKESGASPWILSSRWEGS